MTATEPRRPVRLLLVEDNPSDVALMRAALGRLDWPVEAHHAPDAEQALSFLCRQDEREPPDAVLLDLKLPKTTGLELLAELKATPRLRSLPVFILTSSTYPKDLARAYELQAAACFTKPLTGYGALLTRIVHFVAAQARVPPGVEVPPASPTDPPPSAEGDALLTALVASAADAIIAVDARGRIDRMNAAAAELFGCVPGEMAGQPLLSIFGETRPGELQAALDQALLGQEPRALATMHDNADETRELSWRLSPIVGADERVVGVSVVARDVTEAKQSARQFQLAVESSPSGMVMVDDDGRILLVNEETERLFGWSRDDLIGKPMTILIPERFRKAHGDHRRGYVQSPERRAMGVGRELYGLRRDGTEFPIEIGLNPIETRQGPLVLSSIVDITERRAAQEALEVQAAELARSNADLEQFVYVASHDLQEPLRMVAGFTQLLADRYADVLDDEGREFIELAQGGAFRMAQLLEDLLSYSRVTTRGAKPSRISPRACLDDALANLALSIEEANAEIVVAGPLPDVLADPTQLAMVWQNLVGNGIKFRRGDGARVRIGGRRLGAYVELSVSDDGIGIPPESAARIFEVFERLHPKHVYPGTGIGLAICKRIVERHGGTIHVRSEGEIGSTFVFTLPAAR